MATVYCRDSSGIAHAIATVSWDSNLIVTVNVTYNESNSWRVKRAGVSGDNYEVQRTDGGTTGSFQAVNGQTYVFQSIINGDWANSLDGSGSFTVGSSSSGGNTVGNTGGNTGGGSEGPVSTYANLNVNVKMGCSVTIKKIENGDEVILTPEYFNSFNAGGDFFSINIISLSVNDKLKIEANALDGYTIDTYYAQGYGIFNYDVEGLEYDSDDETWSVKRTTVGNTSIGEINVSATPVDSNIDNDGLYRDNYLHVIQDMYTEIKVVRTNTSNLEYGAYLGELVNGKQACCNGYVCYRYPIWVDDYFIVQTELINGYVLDSIDYYYLDEDTSTGEFYYPSYYYGAQIIAISRYVGGIQTPMGGAFYIDNGTTFDKYECYIDDGTEWIPIGGGYTKVSGVITTKEDDEPSGINCGFKPDLVMLRRNETYDGYSCSCTAAFDVDADYVNTAMWNDYYYEWLDMYIEREDNGFTVYAYIGDSDFSSAIDFDYVAIKYT